MEMPSYQLHQITRDRAKFVGGAGGGGKGHDTPMMTGYEFRYGRNRHDVICSIGASATPEAQMIAAVAVLIAAQSMCAADTLRVGRPSARGFAGVPLVEAG
jgi:hypothetical protein